VLSHDNKIISQVWCFGVYFKADFGSGQLMIFKIVMETCKMQSMMIAIMKNLFQLNWFIIYLICSCFEWWLNNLLEITPMKRHNNWSYIFYMIHAFLALLRSEYNRHCFLRELHVCLLMLTVISTIFTWIVG
jgi:hypothetical protein